MLDRAAAQQSDDRRLTWRQADALALPFEDQSFDVVACQFGAMFFPDKVQGYREARRVLKPGGRFLFNVWDEISENEFADVVTAGAGRDIPAGPAALHGPHAAWLLRCGQNPRATDHGGIWRNFGRCGGSQ